MRHERREHRQYSDGHEREIGVDRSVCERQPIAPLASDGHRHSDDAEREEGQGDE
jgi:hypothetical protein